MTPLKRYPSHDVWVRALMGTTRFFNVGVGAYDPL